MCWGQLTGTLGKVADPGGYLAEKLAPESLKPYAGLHGTAVANAPPPPPKPYAADFFSSTPWPVAGDDEKKKKTQASSSLGDLFAGGYNNADALGGTSINKVVR